MADKTTFEWEGAVFTILPPTIGRKLVYDQIIFHLKVGGEWLAKHYFARAVSLTEIDGDIGWERPNIGEGKSIQTSFEAWQELPEELGEMWINALNRMTEPLTDTELSPRPDEEVLADEKK